jgi:hypothetical protein
MTRVRVRLPQPIGLVILVCFVAYAGWWSVTRTGPTGELRPTSHARILFPIWTNSALDTSGHVWADEGDVIEIEYEVQLDSGFFSLTVGKTRWPYRGRRLRHEQSRSLRGSAAGRLLYEVKESGRHAIWAGKFSVWKGEARVRWNLRKSS